MLTRTGNISVSLRLAGSTQDDLAGWRPMAGWSCAAGVFWMFVGQPVMSSIQSAFGIAIIVPEWPREILFELLLALLGMSGIRSFDKLKQTSR